jgi:serine/threonine-protein kinase
VKALRPALSRSDWQHLNQLLSQALDLSSAARIDWLERLAPEHAHLRTVLAELLAEADTAADETDTARPPTTVARLASEALASMRRERAGDRIGPWRLVEPLGTGGMGDVWKAARADGVMERSAALKLPRAEWVDRGLAERIARERAILARLQHPNIAVLYDAGMTAEGRPYLALEYVEGLPIDAYVRERRLELRAVVQLLVPVVRAVAYAHSRLVIHRDIKPGNVLVTADGQPKLLDFGISKLMEGEAASAEQTALTRVAGRVLTVAYAAPEQVLGLPVTVAADIYSLGVMLYELVANVRPYRSTTSHALEQEIVQGEPRRPSDLAGDKPRRAALRGDLDAIVLTALKRAPEQRYESAAALADDLERYLAGEPVRARPDSRGYRLRKFVRRNWVPVTAAATAAAAVIVGAGVALWQASVAREQADEAAALNTFVLSLIQQADPHASRETKAADVAMLSAIEQRINAEFRGKPEQLLRLRLTVGDAYRNRGEVVAAQRMYQRAAEDAARRLPIDNLQLLMAHVRAADPELFVSAAAAQRLDRAIELLRKKGREGADLLIDALLMRTELRNYFGVPEFASPAQRMDDLNEALAVTLSEFGEGSRQHLKVALSYAEWQRISRAGDEAQQMLERTLAAARQRTDDAAAGPEYAAVETERLRARCWERRPEDAIPTLWRRADEARAAYGDSSLQVEKLLDALANCYEGLEDPTGRWLRFAGFETAEQREKPPSPRLLRQAESALRWALAERDSLAAERYYERAMENSFAIVDVELRERLTRRVVMLRTCVFAYRGEAEAAASYAAPILETLDAEYARINRVTPFQDRFFECLAFAQRQLGRYHAAVQTMKTFLERCRATKLSFYICEQRALGSLAVAQLWAGSVADARATMEERDRYPRSPNINPDVGMVRGRLRLASGQAKESIEAFRLSYGYWLASSDPRGIYAAETEYWLARAYLAVGDPRGKWMLDEARRTLASSPLGHHRALASHPVP